MNHWNWMHTCRLVTIKAEQSMAAVCHPFLSPCTFESINQSAPLLYHTIKAHGNGTILYYTVRYYTIDDVSTY